jgi:hypothetical protein
MQRGEKVRLSGCASGDGKGCGSVLPSSLSPDSCVLDKRTNTEASHHIVVSVSQEQQIAHNGHRPSLPPNTSYSIRDSVSP